mmetsp:Transcript_15380/g.20403  ORF Transcript_15380/g.20403 Transcript_15380/m.20403 type:complete len:136 (+) Transcript_15380:1045-1452(+)
MLILLFSKMHRMYIHLSYTWYRNSPFLLHIYKMDQIYISAYNDRIFLEPAQTTFSRVKEETNSFFAASTNLIYRRERHPKHNTYALAPSITLSLPSFVSLSNVKKQINLLFQHVSSSPSVSNSLTHWLSFARQSH